MVREAEAFAKEDAALKRKAEVRRELEDAIFDVIDDEDATPRAKAAAEEAEEWVKEKYAQLTVHQLTQKLKELRGPM